MLSASDFPPGLTDKAIYRAALAEYGLGCYDDALKRLLRLPDAGPVHEAQARCRQRLLEKSSRGYNWVEMYLQTQSPIPNLDVAEFVGPIEVVQIPERGRGIRAKRAIKAGDVLVSMPKSSSWGQI